MSLVTPRKGYKSIPWLFGKEIEIPQEWEVKKLKTFVTIQSGEYFQFNEFSEKGVPVLKIDNVMHGKVEWETKTFLDKKYLNSHKEIVLNQGDIVLALNRPITHNQVKVAQLTIKDSPSILYQRVGRFLFKNKHINKDFFYVFLNSPFFKKLLSGILIGSDQPYVRTTELLTKHIPLPPLPEQQKIATILSNVDNLIETTEQVITHSKKVKTGLMQKLLTRGIGHTKFKKVNFGGQIKISIPEEWIVSTLESISKNGTQNGLAISTSDYGVGIPIVGMTKFYASEILSNNNMKEVIINEKTKKLFSLKSFDLLFGRRSMDGKPTGEAGKCIIVSDIFTPIIFESSVIRMSIKHEHNPFFIYHLFKSGLGKRIRVRIIRVSAVSGISSGDLKKLKIPLPPKSEQDRIVNILSNIDSKIESQEQYKEKLERLKKSLMQKLLTGEVRV